MKAYFNLTIWAFTIICLSQKLNKCPDNILYSSSFSRHYISPCQISHSLLFTRAANNLGTQDDECKEDSNRSRRASESSISSTDFSSSDSESSEYDDSFSSSDESNSDDELPNDDCIANRLKSYLALRLPDKFGQPSNSLRRSSSLNPINSNSRHCDTICYSGDIGDSDSDGSDSSSLFPTEGDIVTRLKSYLALKLPEKFTQPSNSPRRTKSLSSINADCRRHSTACISDSSFDLDSFSSDGSDDDNLAGPRACNFHSLPDLCSGSLDATYSSQSTVNNKKATTQSIHPESTLPKSYNQLEAFIERPFYSKRHKSSNSGLLGLRQKAISLSPLFSTKVTSYKSPNPNFEPSCFNQKNLRSNVNPYFTNYCSISNIKLATPTKTTKKRLVKKEVLIKSRSNSLSMHSPTLSKTMPERHQSAILRSAYGSNLKGSSFQSSSVLSNSKSSSKRRAPPPPTNPPCSVKTESEKPQKRRAPPPPATSPYSVKTETKNLQKYRASPPPTSPLCFVKAKKKNLQKRRAPSPPTNSPCSVRAVTKSRKRRAPLPPTHSKSSVKASTRSSNKRRAPSPPSAQPYSLERSLPPSCQELTLLPPIQRSSQSSRAIEKSLQAVTSNLRRRSSSSPPSIPPSLWKHSSSSSSSQQPIRQRSSSLPPRISQRHEHAPTTSTSESFKSSQIKQKPPRPPLPTIQSIHIQRMFNA
ncbi:signal peptide containing cysteine rich protein [Cryptosporidium hominis]